MANHFRNANNFFISILESSRIYLWYLWHIKNAYWLPKEYLIKSHHHPLSEARGKVRKKREKWKKRKENETEEWKKGTQIGENSISQRKFVWIARSHMRYIQMLSMQIYCTNSVAIFFCFFSICSMIDWRRNNESYFHISTCSTNVSTDNVPQSEDVEYKKRERVRERRGQRDWDLKRCTEVRQHERCLALTLVWGFCMSFICSYLPCVRSCIIHRYVCKVILQYFFFLLKITKTWANFRQKDFHSFTSWTESCTALFDSQSVLFGMYCVVYLRACCFCSHAETVKKIFVYGIVCGREPFWFSTSSMDAILQKVLFIGRQFRQHSMKLTKAAAAFFTSLFWLRCRCWLWTWQRFDGTIFPTIYKWFRNLTLEKVKRIETKSVRVWERDGEGKRMNIHLRYG